MNVAVAIDDVHHDALPGASEAGPAPKRIVVAYGFWIFLLSDIVMFSALFAGYAVLVRATAGGPTGAQLFNQVTRRDRNRMSSRLELHVRADVVGNQFDDAALGTYFGAAVTFALGAAFLALELREFADMIARGATPQRSAFLSAFFTLVGCHGLHVAVGLIWLIVMMAQVAIEGLSRHRGAPPALFLAVLARARHHLGRAIHGRLSDGSEPMTETRYDRAPGDGSTLADMEEGTPSGMARRPGRRPPRSSAP